MAMAVAMAVAMVLPPLFLFSSGEPLGTPALVPLQQYIECTPPAELEDKAPARAVGADGEKTADVRVRNLLVSEWRRDESKYW